jgi:hypothetical protein
MQLLPYFSYSCINILCSSSVHLPLFILLFGKLACTLFPDSKRNDAAKLDCTLPIGDDGFSNEGRSSGELIGTEINMESEYDSNLQIGMEYQLSKKIMVFSLSNIEIQ